MKNYIRNMVLKAVMLGKAIRLILKTLKCDVEDWRLKITRKDRGRSENVVNGDKKDRNIWINLEKWKMK